jgi:hypothetical protein
MKGAMLSHESVLFLMGSLAWKKYTNLIINQYYHLDMLTN